VLEESGATRDGLALSKSIGIAPGGNCLDRRLAIGKSDPQCFSLVRRGGPRIAVASLARKNRAPAGIARRLRPSRAFAFQTFVPLRERATGRLAPLATVALDTGPHSGPDTSAHTPLDTRSGSGLRAFLRFALAPGKREARAPGRVAEGQ
jgi:hypothetical protein